MENNLVKKYFVSSYSLDYLSEDSINYLKKVAAFLSEQKIKTVDHILQSYDLPEELISIELTCNVLCDLYPFVINCKGNDLLTKLLAYKIAKTIREKDIDFYK